MKVELNIKSMSADAREVDRYKDKINRHFELSDEDYTPIEYSLFAWCQACSELGNEFVIEEVDCCSGNYRLIIEKKYNKCIECGGHNTTSTSICNVCARNY